MKLWLDSNISLDLSRDAIEAVERGIRVAVAANAHGELLTAELTTAANIIRAHLQHVLAEPTPTDQELLS